MAGGVKFSGWQNVTISDLLVAYRKAKADCFFENTFPTAEKFAEYEANLLPNLENLLRDLHRDNGFKENEAFQGACRVIPKKLRLERKTTVPNSGHVYFSAAERAFEHLKCQNHMVPEFRIIGDFPVVAHVISAYWINCIGRQLDERLADSCYGARLRRLRPESGMSLDRAGEYHVRAIGSFPPYFGSYQKWRRDGFNAIRRELENDKDVIAVSLDLKSYYHFVDPTAMVLPGFLDELGVELDEQELEFNKQFSAFISRWAKRAQAFSEIIGSSHLVPGGLVIGLTASRVISNAMLNKWDRLVKERVAPIHYGRYVDDMFMVLRDSGLVHDGASLLQLLSERLGKDILSKDPGSDHGWSIQLGSNVQGATHIALQADKQKLFVLHGRSGLDLLDSIESEIAELSSEHRLMPSPDQLEDSPAARVLSAAGAVGESADNLRRADGLTIRRLSWALQLRHVETLARDLPPAEWSDARKKFYEFAHSHILRPDTLFSHFNYIPRLLGFAISLGEWGEAERIAAKAYQCLELLRSEVLIGSRIAINGAESLAAASLWDWVVDSLTRLLIDAVVRSYNVEKLDSRAHKQERRLAQLFLSSVSEKLFAEDSIASGLSYSSSRTFFYKSATQVALADLAKEPYKKILRRPGVASLFSHRDEGEESVVMAALGGAEIFVTDDLKLFLSSTRRARLSHLERDRELRESYFPYIFPTRPLSPLDISELAPECVGLPAGDGAVLAEQPSIVWARYSQALRGVWVKPTLRAMELDEDDLPRSKAPVHRDARRLIRVGTDKVGSTVIALPSIKTSNSDWVAMAAGKPNLSRERYGKISEIVNSAIRLRPRPGYLTLPELSLPLEWVESVSSRLMGAGISLIAGTEYRLLPRGRIFSEACLVLADNRMGFSSWVRIWQPKLEPAVNEDRELFSRFGRVWKKFSKDRRIKPVYIHNDVNIGVMVCSELQNSKERVAFQGRVDALVILSWNQDLETFSSLVESAALDVHAYTILVNNRLYGDSRIRVPSKNSFDRDLARVRGGDNDFLVAATLSVDELRSFQSRAKRWPQEGDKYKPVPEGFVLAKNRRRIPS